MWDCLPWIRLEPMSIIIVRKNHPICTARKRSRKSFRRRKRRFKSRDPSRIRRKQAIFLWLRLNNRLRKINRKAKQILKCSSYKVPQRRDSNRAYKSFLWISVPQLRGSQRFKRMLRFRLHQNYLLNFPKSQMIKKLQKNKINDLIIYNLGLTILLEPCKIHHIKLCLFWVLFPPPIEKISYWDHHVIFECWY